MDRIQNGMDIPGRLRGGVAAIGNFDGFHLGHQAVVRQAMRRAKERGVPTLVVTFDPHPVQLFRPASPPFALTTLDQKLDHLEAFGVDGVIVLGFDAAFAALSAEAFVTDVLVKRLGASGVVTGADFTFGKGAAGNADFLAALGREHGYRAETVRPVKDEGGVIISSTRIRAALQAGHCREAEALMGHPFVIRGVVEHGDKVGRTIGVPTANISLGGYLRPAYGVYAVRCRLPDGRSLGGVANLGIRPMFDPPKELLEVNLFEFSGDLYGAVLDTELVRHLRPEWKLGSLDALKAQIAADAAAARTALAG